MKSIIISSLLFIIAFTACKKTGNELITIQNVKYSGCFSAVKPTNEAINQDLVDSLYATEGDSIITLHIDKVYPCCGILKDSVIVSDNALKIYITDRNPLSMICNCICLFKIDYTLSKINKMPVTVSVYIPNIVTKGYSLWKEIKI